MNYFKIKKIPLTKCVCFLWFIYLFIYIFSFEKIHIFLQFCDKISVFFFSFLCDPLTKLFFFFLPKLFDNFWYVFMEWSFDKIRFFFCNAVTKLAAKFTIFSWDNGTKKPNLCAERRNKMAFRHKDSQTKISLFADIFILCISVNPAINCWFHTHLINQF